MVEYLSFHNSFFLPQDTFQCKWQGHSVTHPLFIFFYGDISQLGVFFSKNEKKGKFCDL
jgi:hypothetical protein